VTLVSDGCNEAGLKESFVWRRANARAERKAALADVRGACRRGLTSDAKEELTCANNGISRARRACSAGRFRGKGSVRLVVRADPRTRPRLKYRRFAWVQGKARIITTDDAGQVQQPVKHGAARMLVLIFSFRNLGSISRISVAVRKRYVELKAVGAQRPHGGYAAIRERAACARKGLRIGRWSTCVRGERDWSDRYKGPVWREIEMPGHEGLYRVSVFRDGSRV
jgi:hypothetical protein